MNCPKCDEDISESFEPDDWSVGISGGWYCDACDLAIGEHEVDRGHDDDVGIAAAPPRADGKIGTPISDLSGQPGKPGYEQFKRIAKSWGHD
jgi:hypothetical protein